MLDKYLKTLLFEHDCVVIPGFGGFVTNYVSAEIHPITNKFLPPQKNVAFNEQLKLNDGLLVSYIARNENLTTDKAMNVVRGFVESLVEGLNGSNQYTLKDIGKFFYNPEHKLEFEPENKVNYAEGSFGLTEFFFKPLQDMSTTNKPGNKPPVKPGNQQKQAGEANKPRKTSVLVLALIPILVLLGAGTFFYLNKDNAAYSSFNPFASMGSKPVAENKVVVAATDSTALASAPVDSIPMEPAASAPEVNEKVGRFYIIAGSFMNESNALKLRYKLSKKGLSPKIISPEGSTNYRVSIEDFDSQEKALQKLKKFKGQFGSAIWLKKI